MSRRQKRITVQISNRRAAGPLNLLVDGTEIKSSAMANGLRTSMRTQSRHQYRKVHMAIDTTTGDIRAAEFTSGDKGDSPVLPHWLEQNPPDEQSGTRRCHTAILERDGTAIIPIRKNGRRWREDCVLPPRPAMTSARLHNAWGGSSGNAGPDTAPEIG